MEPTLTVALCIMYISGGSLLISNLIAAIQTTIETRKLVKSVMPWWKIYDEDVSAKGRMRTSIVGILYGAAILALAILVTVTVITRKQ